MATKKTTAAAVEDIFKFWQQEMGKPLAKLTAGRRTKVEARLKLFSVEDIKRAIRGCKSSAFHMGQNDSGTLYNSLELICRNDEKIEFFMEKSLTTIPKNNKSPLLNKLTDRSWADEDVREVASAIEGEVGDMFDE